MPDLSLGYQVIIQPFVILAAVIYIAWKISRGFYRETVTRDDNISYRVTKWRPTHPRRMVAVGGLALLFVLTTVVVPFGHRGVIWTTAGVDPNPRPPGLSFILPVVHTDVLVDTRSQRFETVFDDDHSKAGEPSAYIQTSDLQEVSLRVAAVWNVNPARAPAFVNEVGMDNAPAILESVIFDAIKEQSGRCLPDEAGVCQRQAVSFAQELGPLAEDMAIQVVSEAERYHIDVTSLLIADAVFDSEFLQSIKAKVIADQKAEEERRLVAARSAEREQRIILADAAREEARLAGLGEGERIAAVAESLGFSPDEYLHWLLLQTWDGRLPTTLVGDSGEFGILFSVSSENNVE